MVEKPVNINQDRLKISEEFRPSLIDLFSGRKTEDFDINDDLWGLSEIKTENEIGSNQLITTIDYNYLTISDVSEINDFLSFYDVDCFYSGSNMKVRISGIFSEEERESILFFIDNISKKKESRLDLEKILEKNFLTEDDIEDNPYKLKRVIPVFERETILTAFEKEVPEYVKTSRLYNVFSKYLKNADSSELAAFLAESDSFVSILKSYALYSNQGEFYLDRENALKTDSAIGLLEKYANHHRFC